MFSYLRYFFGASVIIILAGAILFGWNYRNAADKIITKQAEQNNRALSTSFSKIVWRDYSAMMQQYFYFMKPEDRAQYQEFLDFGNKTRNLLLDMEVVKLNIYTPAGDVLISTNQFRELNANDPKAVITGFENSKIAPSTIFTSGKIESEIVYDATYFKPFGAAAKGVLIRSLIPLKPDNLPDNVISDPAQQNSGSNVQAVMEIYFDVTENAETLRSYQYYGSALIMLIFAILYMALIYTSRRAEKIIERQHETNIELAAAKASAETENEQKSQFLANISHELRTPLNAIIGFSEIIKDEVMGAINNEQYKNYIKDIHSSGVHLLSLINDILDYSKAEAGKLDLEYQDIDLGKLIASSLRLQEPRAKSADVELVRELPDEQLIIRSDPKRLKQVLLNLLSNAVKFTPSGGDVKISAWRNLQDTDHISIEVKDSGIGIAPKDIAKALSPFGQVDSELSRRYEGTGLGLPLTKKFTELLGGQLKLSSEVNRGTTVTVILPINNDPSAGIAK